MSRKELKEYSCEISTLRLIEEVKRRPDLYRGKCSRDRKVELWKEVGRVLYPDWDSCNRAAAYDRVLEMMRRWRSLRDAYNREIRCRLKGVRVNGKTYVHYKRLKFLGGYEGSDSESEGAETITDNVEDAPEQDTVQCDPIKPSEAKPRKRRRSRASSCPSDEVAMPMPVDVPEDFDSDKMFLLSFVQEMRQFPPDIKMWVRAQIANVMQEAVTAQMNNVQLSSSSARNTFKPSRDSFD